MESLAAQGSLAAVLDFSLVEVSNHANSSVVSAGPDRLENAGRAGVPQIVAPGGVTLVDMCAWTEPPTVFANREIHEHNRLIACAIMSNEERRLAAKTIAAKLNRATGPVAFIMPLGGIDEWDREGGPFHNPEGLAIFAEEMRVSLSDDIDYIELQAHINDAEFSNKVLKIFDYWVEEGKVLR